MRGGNKERERNEMRGVDRERERNEMIIIEINILYIKT